MENLNNENIKFGLECIGREEDVLCADCVYRKYDGLECHRIVAREALALITSQEQRIGELTEKSKNFEQAYDCMHSACLELSDKCDRLTEENEKLLTALANYDRLTDVRIAEEYYTAEAYEELREENERLRAHIQEGIDLANQIPTMVVETAIATVNKMHSEIKERCIKGGIYPAFVASTIDQIAREMLEGE